MIEGPAIALLVVIYLLLGGVAAIVVDAVADITGLSASTLVREPLALVIVALWLPMIVVVAVVLTLGFLSLGIRR